MPIRYLNEIRTPPGRVRKEFSPEAIEELAKSILDVGLLHPPVVEADGTLLAGERRLRALTLINQRKETYHSNGKFIQPGLIMVTDIRELTRPQRLQAEIDENTIRVDISWQEKAEAVARLHELRALQSGATEATAGIPFKETMAIVAADLRDKPVDEVTARDIDDIRADLLVQAWMKNHPDDTEVSGARSRADAIKTIETKMEDEHRAALARRFLAKKESAGIHIVELADMRTQLPLIPDGQFDAIITDPPWGVQSHEWTNQEAIRQHSYLDDMATFETIHEILATEGYRICKPKAHLYLFCSFRKFEELRRRFASAGWDVWPQPLIWWKGPNNGIAPRPEHGPRQTYECVLYAIKGNKRVLSLRPDVIFAPSGTLARAAEKPPSVYWELLSRTCLPGDEVLDPCCGAAPLLPAANALKLRATCYDIAEDAIGLASGRVAEVYVPGNIRIFEEGTVERQGVRVKR